MTAWTLAGQCGNETIKLLTGILETVWFATARRLARDPAAHRDDREERIELVESRERICDLIEAGEDFRLHEMMTEHIEMHRLYAHGLERAEGVNAVAIRDSRGRDEQRGIPDKRRGTGHDGQH